MTGNFFRVFACICCISFILFSRQTYSQQKYRLNGIVLDSTNRQPLEYVTVSLIKYGDKIPMNNTYTDPLGHFGFSLDTASYTIAFNSVGFKAKIMSFKANQKDSIVNLNISLEALSTHLKEVNITAVKKVIEQQRDKIVYNAENDPMAKSEMATDILKKTPMVSVDGDGNVQINGKGNFKVLLNGRETATFAQNAKEALKSFPGAAISKIEVITSPSAKYDAEGTDGIINIITKKSVIGYNGNASLYFSTINYLAGTNLSLRQGKLGIIANYTLHGNNKTPGRLLSETKALEPSIYSSRILSGERINDRLSHNGNLEAVYDIDSLNSVVLYASITGGDSRDALDQEVSTILTNGDKTKDSFSQLNKSVFPEYGVGSEFIKKYKKAGKELSIRFNSIFSRNDKFTNSFLGSGDTGLFRDNTSISRNREYNLQTDFVQPLIQDWKIESGAKIIFRNAASDYDSFFKNLIKEQFIRDEANSSDFNYSQQVYSGYSSLNFSLNKFNLRLGARIEHTQVHGEFMQEQQQVKQSYTAFIPDFLISRKLSSTYTILLSYNKRLQRPYITTLNPFVNNNDPYNVSFGNPELTVQRIHNISLQNRIIKGNFFSSISLNGSYSNDMIVQYADYDNRTGINTITYGNTGRNIEGSVNFSGNLTIGKKMRLGTSANIKYNKIVNTGSQTQQAMGTSGLVTGNFSYKVSTKVSFSGSGGIFKPGYSLLENRSLVHFYQLNSSYQFFKQQLTLRVNANNFLSKWNTVKTTTSDRNFKTEKNLTAPFRIIVIGLTHNFGKLKESVSKKKGINNDDVL